MGRLIPGVTPTQPLLDSGLYRLSFQPGTIKRDCLSHCLLVLFNQRRRHVCAARAYVIRPVLELSTSTPYAYLGEIGSTTFFSFSTRPEWRTGQPPRFGAPRRQFQWKYSVILGIRHARTGPTRFSPHLSTQSSRRSPWLTCRSLLSCLGHLARILQCDACYSFRRAASGNWVTDNLVFLDRIAGIAFTAFLMGKSRSLMGQ